MFTRHGGLETQTSFRLASVSRNTRWEPRRMRVWEDEPVHKQHSSLPVGLTNSDGQLTHSSRGPRLLRGHGKRQRIRLSNPEGCCCMLVVVGFF